MHVSIKPSGPSSWATEPDGGLGHVHGRSRRVIGSADARDDPRRAPTASRGSGGRRSATGQTSSSQDLRICLVEVERPQDVVAAGYDRIAGRYAEWRSGIVGDPRALYVDRMLTLLPASPSILEIGSGGGVEPTPTLARRGRLVGVDISIAQVERARTSVPDGHFIHGDILDVDFEEGGFDAVVALYVLIHIPTAELPRLVNRVSAWLRPEGVFLATFSSAGVHDGYDEWLGVRMFFSGLDRNITEELVEAAGMRVVESQIEPMQEPEGEVRFHWLLAQKMNG